MTDRPAPPENNWAPEFAYMAEPRPGWRLDETRRCRYTVGPGRKQCQRPSVAALNRKRLVWGTGWADSWWGYCDIPGHMYGNWIENGQIMGWILQRKDGGDD